MADDNDSNGDGDTVVEDVIEEVVDAVETVTEPVVDMMSVVLDGINGLDTRLAALEQKLVTPVVEDVKPDTLDEIVADETIPKEEDKPKPRHRYFR